MVYIQNDRTGYDCCLFALLFIAHLQGLINNSTFLFIIFTSYDNNLFKIKFIMVILVKQFQTFNAFNTVSEIKYSLNVQIK